MKAGKQAAFPLSPLLKRHIFLLRLDNAGKERFQVLKLFRGDYFITICFKVSVYHQLFAGFFFKGQLVAHIAQLQAGIARHLVKLFACR